MRFCCCCMVEYKWFYYVTLGLKFKNSIAVVWSTHAPQSLPPIISLAIVIFFSFSQNCSLAENIVSRIIRNNKKMCVCLCVYVLCICNFMCVCGFFVERASIGSHQVYSSGFTFDKFSSLGLALPKIDADCLVSANAFKGSVAVRGFRTNFGLSASSVWLCLHLIG